MIENIITKDKNNATWVENRVGNEYKSRSMRIKVMAPEIQEKCIFDYWDIYKLVKNTWRNG